MNNRNSIAGKLMAHAFSASPVAFVFGLCLARNLLRPFDPWYLTGLVLSGACLTLALLWTRRAVGRLAAAQLATSETARTSARQFLFSCVTYSLNTATFGIVVAGFLWIWTFSDFVGIFIVVWFGALMGVGVYPVRRDAKSLASALSC